MGSGKSKAAVKEIFDKFDQAKTGVLTLDEILSIRAMPGFNHPVTNSPLLLFQFDSSKCGGINKEDFCQLVKYLEQVEKQNKINPPTQVHAHTIDLEKVPGLRDRDSAIPPIAGSTIGNVASSDSETGGENSDSSSSTTSTSTTASNTGNTSSSAGELGSTMKEDSKALLQKVLTTPNSKESFVSWLFKLADIKHNETIEEDELAYLLNALELDGISSDVLTHNTETSPQTSTKKTPSERAKRIMEEYSNGRARFLTKEQFFVLAELILKHYEVQSASSASDRVGKYEFKQKLGKGSQAVVKMAIDTETGAKKAIKIAKKGNVSDMSRMDVEIKAMKLLQHRNIVTLEEVMETEENVFFVMELCEGGNLAEHVAMEVLSNNMAKHFFSQLVDCVIYCHQHGVCHRDLKLENIVLDSTGKLIKVVDFGHAGIFQKGWDYFSSGLVGSLYHISPEQVEGQSYSGEKVDTWAMGVALYRMLVGKPPFLSDSAKEIVELIKQGVYTPPPDMDPAAVDLLSRMLVVDPNNRVSLCDIQHHPWLTSCPAQVPSLFDSHLKLEPTTRAQTVWALLHDSLKKLNIVFIQATNDPQTLWCHFVTKDMVRFNATLRLYAEGPYFEFTYVSGSGLVLRRTIAELKQIFEEQVDMLKKRRLTIKAPSGNIDTTMLITSAYELAQNFKQLFNTLLQNNKATILVSGKTGVGKSAVANKAFGWKLAQVGKGVSVTTGITKYSIAWKPMVIFDSRGFEMGPEDELASLKQFLEEHSQISQQDCIHVIWYVVDASSARFEPFEIELCRDVLSKFPLLILVNKADLCTQQDLSNLCATIEGMQIPNVHGVIPTVADPPEGVGAISVEKCPRCASEDISVFQRRKTFRCNSCSYEQSIERPAWLTEDGFRKVVEISETLVPESVKTSFIATQKVSRQLKIDKSKVIIRRFHQEENGNSLAVLQMLTSLCSLWDMPQSGSGGITQQILCMIPRRRRKKRSTSSALKKDTNNAPQTTVPPLNIPVSVPASTQTGALPSPQLPPPSPSTPAIPTAAATATTATTVPTATAATSTSTSTSTTPEKSGKSDKHKKHRTGSAEPPVRVVVKKHGGKVTRATEAIHPKHSDQTTSTTDASDVADADVSSDDEGTVSGSGNTSDAQPSVSPRSRRNSNSNPPFPTVQNPPSPRNRRGSTPTPPGPIPAKPTVPTVSQGRPSTPSSASATSATSGFATGDDLADDETSSSEGEDSRGHPTFLEGMMGRLMRLLRFSPEKAASKKPSPSGKPVTSKIPPPPPPPPLASSTAITTSPLSVSVSNSTSPTASPALPEKPVEVQITAGSYSEGDVDLETNTPNSAAEDVVDVNHTTALAIAWVASLQRLHHLLVEHSYSNNRVETDKYIGQCVEAAFLDFQEEYLIDYCAMLRDHSLDDVIDAVLSRT
ncbi:protein kinase [Pelomyxa schiedti]|nr:protein kinase [Pelomyxa schiedti]